MSTLKIPAATYRLQFNPSFGFKQGNQVVEYLSELGISYIYASPIFKPKKGSDHGYDVVDQNEFNPELGTPENLEELLTNCQNHGIGWLQDIVPNHMAYDGENRVLMDVLENGQSSKYFGFFDIEWNHPYETLKGKVVAPFLGRLYGESLEDGEITLRYDRDGFTVNYYDLRFPLKIESYINVVSYRLGNLKKRVGDDSPDFINFLGILYSLKNLPASREDVNDRYDQIMFVKRMLWELYNRNEEIKSFIDENIKIFNGEAGNPESFNLFHTLLSEQNFRLCFWKVATEEINYRRFFNINRLISLRIEDMGVFNQTHSLIFRMAKEGKFNGVRIDHIDGLYDPTGYLQRLKENIGDVYTVVEKILHPEEELPEFWPVEGTTGYDFLNYVNGIFCDGNNENAFTRLYTEFTGLTNPFEDLVAEKKRLIMGKHMAGDIDNLAHLMKRISSKHRHGYDITIYGLRRALVEVMAHFPVYRTYISEDHFSEKDRAYIKEAVKRALAANPVLYNELDFIEQFLLVKPGEYLSEDEKKECLDFISRFQQFTGPLMAKGFEDTTLYVYNRLISLNEVGGDPKKFGISSDEFHRFNLKRAKGWPYTMNALSTHDTKRGEDVRARINVLSEMPEEWKAKIKKWSKLNEKKKRMINGKSVPDRNDEYFLYQTLIGAFPFYEAASSQSSLITGWIEGNGKYHDFVERIKQYTVKAIREAKVYTAWLKPDTDYEEAFISFVHEILNPSERNEFLKDFLAFQNKVAYYGIFNSLSQTLIKITSPGVPDFYQGTELWDLNLVDPDNRRPVDFEKRKRFLREIKELGEGNILELIGELISRKEDGRIKLFLIYKSLEARNRRIELFENGEYLPLPVEGRYNHHVIAYARRDKNGSAITVAPRFITYLAKEKEYPFGINVWKDTRIVIPEGLGQSWKDCFTENIIRVESEVAVGEILKHFPVALLLSE